MDITKKNQLRMNELTPNNCGLAKQVEALDWEELKIALNECIVNKDQSILPEDYDAASYLPQKPENAEQEKLYTRAFDHGEQLIRAGKTAAFTVAGGQGTRLGYDGPKGTLPVSPIKKKPLFQLFAEQIRGISEKYDVLIPWYIMCSPLNLEATFEHFKENNFYELGEGEIKFFDQGVMPATDFNGNLLLANQDSLALSPNGHGGALKALIDSKSIADMANRGVEHISYFQVDNPLVSIINPLFIGLHDLQKSDMSSRSLTKTGPFEKLGNFVSVGDRITIIEYSDLPEEKALEQELDGRIKYRAGSPAIHVLRRDFVEQFASGEIRLPYHRAEKKVAYLNDSGELVIPEKPNAVKFETFVFDALPLAKNPLILEADRLEEFSPVKNKTGVDSLESSQVDQIKRARRWLKNTGHSIKESAILELCPRAFPDEQELLGACLEKYDLKADAIYLGNEKDFEKFLHNS
jgi:UDP-N-acetylglucosamine/UDP-N-acetylgalactosamine diphosphorylase